MLSNVLYILVAILILGVIIVVHEFGHFIAGRLCGIGVEEFSVGFGPRLLGWRRKNTDYSLRAIPLGGYCRFAGEDASDPAPDAMNNAVVWKRIITIAAGAMMNFVLAYVAAVAMLCLFFIGDILPKVDAVVADSAAAVAQLQPGDVVAAVDGAAVSYDQQGVEMLRSAIQQKNSVELTVQRGGETLTIPIAAREVVVDEATGETARQIGVNFTARTYTLGEAIPGAGQYMADVTKMLFDTLKNLIFRGEGADEMAGTVGTVVVVSEVVREDSRMVLNILFLLSLNIGIMNLLPLPALDGGRLVFLLVEAVRGKPVPPEKEGMVHAIGMFLLFALFIVLTFHDIQKFILG